MRQKWSAVLYALPILAGAAAPRLTWADQVKGFACPATGDPYEVVQCFDDKGKPKPGFPKQNSKPFNDGEDVNGDGKKDRLGSVMTDAKGNKVECWCLQKSDKTPQQFAYAFVPAGGGGRKWFGGCYFPNGQNGLKCEGDVVKKGPDKGKIDEYTKVSQYNVDRGTDNTKPPDGTKDKHFCYFNSGPNKGKILKTLTEGRWVKISDTPPRWRYETTKTTPCPIKDPPAQPQDLLAQVFTTNDVATRVAIASPEEGLTLDVPEMTLLDSDTAPGPTPPPGPIRPPGPQPLPPPPSDTPFDPNDPAMIAALGDFPGADFPSATVIVNTDSLPNWQYRLLIPPPLDGFDGTDPNAGYSTQAEVSIHAGDEFTLTGIGIRSASVSAEATRPQLGAWVLTEFDSEHASFRATTNATPPAGVPFGSFILVSDAPLGSTRWAYMGGDIGMSSDTMGPSDQPPASTASPQRHRRH